jgi:hypothetical protein
MRIVIENIEPLELWKLMEDFMKKSDIKFGNKNELIQKWDDYKNELIDKQNKLDKINGVES